MYPWISPTLDFWLQFHEEKCGLYMDVYSTFSEFSKGKRIYVNIPVALDKIPTVTYEPSEITT